MIEFVIDPEIPEHKLSILNEIESTLSEISKNYKIEENIKIFVYADSDLGHFRSFLLKIEREQLLPSQHTDVIVPMAYDIIKNYGTFIRLKNPTPFFVHINSPFVTAFHEYFHTYFYIHQYDIRHCEEFFCEYLSIGYALKFDDNFDPMAFLIDNNISIDQSKKEYTKILSLIIKNSTSSIKHPVSPNNEYILRYLAVWRFFKDNYISQGDFQASWDEMCNAFKPYEPEKVIKYQKIKNLLINSTDITDFNAIEDEMKQILEYKEYTDKDGS